MKQYIKVSWFVGILLLLGSRPGFAAPNILFIFSDDHRYDLLGVVNPKIYTPNMDALADSGVYFTNAFVTTAICSPSRASCMTGRYGSVNGVRSLSQFIDADERTFADYLGGAGYRTAVIGKWHVKNSPQDLGFQHWATFHSNGSWFHRSIASNIPGVPKNLNGQFIEAFNADRAIDYIQDHVRHHQDRPFVLWVCNQVPHLDGSLKYPASLASLQQYHAADMPVPDNWTDDLASKPSYLRTSRSLTKSAAENYGGLGGYTSMAPGVRNAYRGQDNVQNHNRQYYASITDWDREMGRLLDSLGDPDGDGDHSDSILDNTWIILMGDNGWFTGHHKFTSKVLTYEESMRVPMLVRPPLLPDGSPSVPPRFEDALVLNTDLTALMLEVGGISRPANLHGRDLKALIDNQDILWRDRVYYEAPEAELGAFPHESVRTDRYKYIRTYADAIGSTLVFEELYDLVTDPFEMVNTFDDMRHWQRVQVLRDLIRVERQTILATDNGGAAMIKPVAPTNLTATVTPTGILLRWQGNQKKDLRLYFVYRRTNNGDGYHVIASLSGRTPASSYRDGDVVSDTSYFYRVTAVDKHYNESSFSNEAAVAN